MQPRRDVVEQRAVAGADIDHLERPPAPPKRAFSAALARNSCRAATDRDREGRREAERQGDARQVGNRTHDLSPGMTCGAAGVGLEPMRPQRHEGPASSRKGGIRSGNRCACAPWRDHARVFPASDPALPAAGHALHGAVGSRGSRPTPRGLQIIPGDKP